MFFFQLLLMSLRGLRANLLRSLLAPLGVILGVGAVISAMSILEGAQRDIVERFESLGGETITVYPAIAKRGGRSMGIVPTLTVGDAEAISDKRRCPSVKAATPEVSGMVSIKYFSRNKEATVLGTNQEYAIYFSTDPGPTVSAILEFLAAENDSLIDLRVERPSLEERFLEITGNGGTT